MAHENEQIVESCEWSCVVTFPDSWTPAGEVHAGKYLGCCREGSYMLVLTGMGMRCLSTLVNQEKKIDCSELEY